MIVHHQAKKMTTDVIDFLETAPEDVNSIDRDSQNITQVTKDLLFCAGS